MSVQNKMVSAFSIILRGLTLIFSGMHENLIAGLTWRSELKLNVSHSVQNVTVL